jgi:hypothetical protein
MATPYSFTQPIRYYKANDPYYYELDNIPIRQLEENILYVKGLVEAGTGGGPGTGGLGSGYLTENSELDITMIKQLKPKAGGGRTVSVNGGRFVSRVNDAFNINKPLNRLLFGTPPTATQVGMGDIEQLWTSGQRQIVWDNFVGSSAATKAYNMNGLETRYTFHSTPGSVGNSWNTTYGPPFTRMYPHYSGVNLANAPMWPGSSMSGKLSPTVWSGNRVMKDNLQTVHLAFVQMWRGVFRTSVVEFPDSSLEVPAWDDSDFYYTDSNGDVQDIQANQRIDLLVAYSLPIDASSTTLNNYETGFCNGAVPTPQTLTTPTLGLVRGAGIGIEKDDQSNPLSINTTDGCEDTGVPGSPRIVANVSDNNPDANVGIKRINGSVVHGSFPSPDDLLNNAPVIALGVENDAWSLIGQAALPLAYVVVTKGQNTITSADIIDIRPFLRTTEFTYNERAGIGAANPPLSFANPAVGAFQLQNAIDATLNAQSDNSADVNNGRAIYTDYVMGGLAYGVEGTLLTMCDGPQEVQDPFGYQSQTAAYIDPVNGSSLSFSQFDSAKNYLDNTDQYLREAFLQYVYNNRQTDLKRWLADPNSSFSENPYTYLGLPEGGSGRNIPLFPEWDMPMNGTNYLNLMGQGTQGSTAAIPKPTWWMWFESVDQPHRPFVYVPGAVASLTDSTSPLTYLEKVYQFGTGSSFGSGMINTITKKLEITFPSWVNAYDVMVEYVNCGPATSYSEGGGSDDRTVGLGTGLNVNKGPVVSYPSGQKKAIVQINSNAQMHSDGGTGFTQDGVIKDKLAGPNQAGNEAVNESYKWLSYVISLPQFVNEKFGTGNQITTPDQSMRFTPKFGASYYPTVKFTIIGYTGDPISSNQSYTETGNNFTLIQGVQAGDSSLLTADIGPVNGTSKIDIENM